MLAQLSEPPPLAPLYATDTEPLAHVILNSIRSFDPKEDTVMLGVKETGVPNELDVVVYSVVVDAQFPLVHWRIASVYDDDPELEMSRVTSQVFAVPITMLAGCPAGVYQQMACPAAERVVLVAELPAVVLAPNLFAVGQSPGAGAVGPTLVKNHCWFPLNT